MAKKKEEKPKFGDIIENHELVKRTLMVAAYPALIKQTLKNGKTVFEGFLPGFEFAEIEDIADEDECVEQLQDMLDDEVEELVVFGKSLPFVEEDEVLNQKYPEHKIVYLDINVYATPEELDYYDACSHDCSSCSHDCDCEDEEYFHHCDCGCEDEHCDCEDEYCDCEEDEKHEGCSCGHEHHHECSCGDNHDHCNCSEEEHHKENCNCNGEHKHGKNCKGKKGNCKNKK